MPNLLKYRSRAYLAEFAGILLNLVIQTVEWVTLESYGNDMFACVITAHLGLGILHHFEYTNPKSYRNLYGGYLGALSPLLTVLAPHWALINVLFHFILQHLVATKNYEHSGQTSFMITSSIGWLACYSYFVFGEPDTFHDSIEIRNLFGNPHHLVQVSVGLIVSNIVFMVGKTVKTEETQSYLSKLQESHNKLEKANQDLKQALAEKESLILRFSHEIRNPLNSLLGNVDLAYEAVQDPSIREMLRGAKVSSEVLLHLMSNVLDSAKLESRGLDISKRNHDFRRFMEKAWVVF